MGRKLVDFAPSDKDGLRSDPRIRVRFTPLRPHFWVG
jgi:hypothetical protein